MEGMVVSASTGVMSSLLSKLSVLLSDQYKQLKGVRRDIESLSRELTDMNAALVRLAEREKLDVQTKVWRNKVRDMAYDIEDVIDIFMHHHGHGDGNDGLFLKAARKIRKLRARFQITGMIQDIKARVEEQGQSRDRYKVEEFVSKPTVVEVDPRLPAMFEDAKRLVGIDGPREEITKLLMEDGATDSGQLLKVVSIVGFGGLGKTTLANQVYTKIKNDFECMAFVSVSRTPHVPTILKDILSKVGCSVGTEMEDDVQKLLERLRAELMNKRYLIIIDDLWSTKDWCTIECTFLENNNGSRVITTTRNHGVAIACCFPGQGHVYKMQPLDENHSRRLFFKRLFNTENGCPEQLKEISDDMLRKCKGVPLAITSIASLLANQSTHVESWEKIRHSLGSELDTNPTLDWMRHVLSLSYNDLSHELKTCLLYLGIIKENLGTGICSQAAVFSLTSKHGFGVLHLTASQGHLEVCKYLVEELGGDPNITADEGVTPVMVSAQFDHVSTVKYLLDHGGELMKSDDKGFSVLHHAVFTGSCNVTEFLLAKGIPVDIDFGRGTSLYQASIAGQDRTMKILLDHHANPNSIFSGICTPLMGALINRSLKCMKLLIKAGADVNGKGIVSSPLAVATELGGYTKFIQLLLKSGADPNIPDELGRLPIEIAASHDCREEVEMLFPMTSPIPNVSNWSIDGVISHAKLKSAKPLNEPQINGTKALFKSQANKAFKRKEYELASKIYGLALDNEPDATIYSNRSLCKLLMGDGEGALSDAYQCRMMRPDWAKACYRQAAAHMLLKEYKEAHDALLDAQKLDPGSDEIERELRKATELLKTSSEA